MNCAWKELLSILPQWMRRDVDRVGKDKLQELRLRINAPPELVMGPDSLWLDKSTGPEELSFCVNAASRYSPWAAATVRDGYLTAPGGHRIGLCGTAVCQDGRMTGIREISSLCIRVCRDYPGIGAGLANGKESVLILGAPGWGKTTLLRDLIRHRSEAGEHITVVDERGELFPADFRKGKCTDVMYLSPKRDGILSAMRTMGPECIAVDEITDPEDARALLFTAWCGVKLLATAHASAMGDFLTRPVYRELVKNHIFDKIVILHQDKSWHVERSY